MGIYRPIEDEEGVFMERNCHGLWWMKGDSLYLDAYNPKGEMVGGLFPVLISPSGEQLYITQSDDGSCPPFLRMRKPVPY